MQDPIIIEIKKRMLELGWTNGDLAQATGYKTSTINAYMSNLSARERSKAVGEVICKTLQIAQ